MKIMSVIKLWIVFDETNVLLCYHHILFYFMFLKGKNQSEKNLFKMVNCLFSLLPDECVDRFIKFFGLSNAMDTFVGRK